MIPRVLGQLLLAGIPISTKKKKKKKKKILIPTIFPLTLISNINEVL